jgi:uncharacterized protein involved in outer membrane biogenesis
MKKWIIVGAVVVIAIVLFLLVGISNLGPLIKNGVNTYGPRITKTEVRLGDVGLSLFSGQANLKDLYMGNPKGFRSPEAMKVRSIHVDLDEKSLAGDTIIIDRIEVIGPEITYEKVTTTDNFQTILNNMKETMGGGGPSTGKSEKSVGGKKLLVKDFIVRGGKVNLAVSAVVQKDITASLPDMHLKEVGKGGVPAAQVFAEIVAALYQEITSRSVTETLNQELKALGLDKEGLAGTVGEDAKKDLEGVTERVKGLFGK